MVSSMARDGHVHADAISGYRTASTARARQGNCAIMGMCRLLGEQVRHIGIIIQK
jgi:hypothetical protein